MSQTAAEVEKLARQIDPKAKYVTLKNRWFEYTIVDFEDAAEMLNDNETSDDELTSMTFRSARAAKAYAKAHDDHDAIV